MKEAVKTILERTGTRDEIAAECGVEPIAVYRWGQNGSIPSKHLAGVLRVASRNKAAVTADLLCISLSSNPAAVSPSTRGAE